MRSTVAKTLRKLARATSPQPGDPMFAAFNFERHYTNVKKRHLGANRHERRDGLRTVRHALAVMRLDSHAVAPISLKPKVVEPEQIIGPPEPPAKKVVVKRKNKADHLFMGTMDGTTTQCVQCGGTKSIHPVAKKTAKDLVIVKKTAKRATKK